MLDHKASDPLHPAPLRQGCLKFRIFLGVMGRGSALGSHSKASPEFWL